MADTITRFRRRIGRWLLGETDRPAPVPGPVYVVGLPCLVALDVDVLVRANVSDLLNLLIDEFADDLAEIAEARPAADPFAPERLAFEELVDRLVKRLATRAALTPQQALRVAEQVRELAEARMPRVPAQRAAEGGAA